MILAIVQARVCSTRLPGKVLKPIVGKPIVLHLVERLQRSKLINKIIIATGDKEENRALVELCRKNNINIFVGSEDNVLDRFYQAAKKFSSGVDDIIVRITGDCPVIDPNITDKTIQYYLDNQEKFDYVNNGIEHTYPDGLGTEVFPFKILKTAWKEATKKTEKEHVTTLIRDPSRFRIGIVKNETDLSSLRWTVDTEKDFKFITKVYEHLYPKKKIFLMEDILALLKKKPELKKINSGIERDEGFKRLLKIEEGIKSAKTEIKWKENKIIKTKNISLWPSLFITNADDIFLSWYEYSSPHYPKETDIFLSKLTSGQFKPPTKITNCPGYDNGPNLFIDKKNTIWISWHSWRPPGKGPFTPDSCENIWIKYKKENHPWSKPFLIFPSLEGTNYPALIENEKGGYVMAFTIEKNKEIYVSRSQDGLHWEKAIKINFAGIIRADLIQDRSGRYLIACEHETKDKPAIIIIQSEDLKNWNKIAEIPNSNNGRRPKISQVNNRFFVVWQTDHWPAKQINTLIEVKDGKLEIEFSPENSGGNHCWTLNYLEIESIDGKIIKKFDFGNKETNDNETIKIGAKNHQYHQEKGYGFFKEIKDLMRSFAVGVASDMVYSNQNNSFRVDLPNGEYQIKLLISSWIASSKKVSIKANETPIFEPQDAESDDIFYSCSSDGYSWSKPILVERNNYDLNRPSKIIQASSQKYYLATTSFDKGGVNIKLYSGEGGEGKKR